MKIITYLLAFYISCCVASPSYALEGKVIKISDGDTITVLSKNLEQFKIRLYGIDCPEKKQAFGNRAKQFTADFLGNSQVEVIEYDTDRYGRIVGVVLKDGINFNEKLIEAGLAWVYTKYCKENFCREWKIKESEAIKAEKGLWRDDNVIAPWDWRKIK